MNQTNVHPKILTTIERMICDFKLNYQFYGEFCNYINFHRNNDPHQMPTMGVNVSKGGMNFHFNDNFLDPLPQEQVNWGVIHELLHLLYDHPARSANYNHQLANVAQDMIINYIIDHDFDQKFAQRIPNCLTLPTEYEKLVKDNDKKLYFEDVYNWLLEKKEEYEQEKQKNGQPQDSDSDDSQSDGSGNSSEGEDGDSDSDSQGSGSGSGTGNSGDSDSDSQGSGSGKPADGRPDENGKYPNGTKSKVEKPLRDLFDNMNENGDSEMTVDKHMENEVDNDYAKEVVNQVKEGLKARGLGKGNVESVLDKIQRKRKDYLKEIKRSISALKGSSIYKTINRPNVFSVEGVKGKKRTGKGLNVILDTSGSMGGSFEKILSYVFQRNIILNLIQVDTGVQSFTTIADLKDFNKLKISGYGGTELQPGIDYIKTKKELMGFNLLVLTDGYTDTLNFNNLPGCKKVLIISNGTKTPIASSNKMPLKEIVVNE